MDLKRVGSSMDTIIGLLVLLLVLSSCGRPASCPARATLCGSQDRFGYACVTYDEYKSAGADVSDAESDCHLAHVVR